MHEDLQRLIALITETVAVLESDGEGHWRAWLVRIRSSLEAGDTYGARELLSGYGGMGSFNDLVLGQANQNGRSAWQSNAVELNRRFDELRGQMWQVAKQIRHPDHGRA
jgi:hypothetical protein